ncbi:MAG: PQQ-binding-like beta-propeller repeat protein [Nitrososphaeria archaeon]
MRIKFARFFLVSLTVLLCLSLLPFAGATDDWTMFRHDAAHSGYSTSSSSGGVKLWSFPTGDQVESSPAVAGGVVYVGSYDHNVYALNASTGAKIWSYTTGDWVTSSPAVVGGVVYVGSYDNNTYALNASSGVKLWSFTTGGWVFSSPAVVGGVVYVGSEDGNVYALNALIWQ